MRLIVLVVLALVLLPTASAYPKRPETRFDDMVEALAENLAGRDPTELPDVPPVPPAPGVPPVPAVPDLDDVEVGRGLPPLPDPDVEDPDGLPEAPLLPIDALCALAEERWPSSAPVDRAGGSATDVAEDTIDGGAAIVALCSQIFL